MRLFPAVSPRDVHFHLLHDADGARIRFQRVCAADGRPVENEHIVKGYEIARDQYVTISPQELEAVDPKATRTIEVLDFVDLSSIDPLYFESTYRLLPDRGGARAWALLVETMRRTGRVAIATMVLRTRQYLCAVRATGRGLLLSTMYYADEVVPESEYDAPEIEPTRERELEMARQLVDSLSTDFEPSRYRDEYRERVRALVERKAEGREIVVPPEAPPSAAVVDIAEALRASLDQARRRSPRIEHREAPAARRAVAPALDAAPGEEPAPGRRPSRRPRR